MVFNDNTESKTEHTIWKSINNRIQHRFKIVCGTLFEFVYLWQVVVHFVLPKTFQVQLFFTALLLGTKPNIRKNILATWSTRWNVQPGSNAWPINQAVMLLQEYLFYTHKHGLFVKWVLQSNKKLHNFLCKLLQTSKTMHFVALHDFMSHK